MTNSESHKLLTFYSICNFLADFIEDRWCKSSLNVRKTKQLSNQLRLELEKSINHIFASKEAEGVDMSNVLDQFVNASIIMEKLFFVGLEMDLMTTEKKEELNDRMNNLLLEYNIQLNER